MGASARNEEPSRYVWVYIGWSRYSDADIGMALKTSPKLRGHEFSDLEGLEPAKRGNRSLQVVPQLIRAMRLFEILS